MNFFLGLHKWRPSYRRSRQPSKENIRHLKKKWNFVTLPGYSIFVGHFCPPKFRIRIPNRDSGAYTAYTVTERKNFLTVIDGSTVRYTYKWSKWILLTQRRQTKIEGFNWLIEWIFGTGTLPYGPASIIRYSWSGTRTNKVFNISLFFGVLVSWRKL